MRQIRPVKWVRVEVAAFVGRTERERRPRCGAIDLDRYECREARAEGLHDDRRERGRCAPGADDVRLVAFDPRPTEILAARGHAVDLVELILTDVGDEQIAGHRVDVEPERVAQADRPDQRGDVTGTRERVARRHEERTRRGPGAGRRQPAHVEPDDLAVQLRRVLALAIVFVVAEAGVQHAVRAESQARTVVHRLRVRDAVEHDVGLAELQVRARAVGQRTGHRIARDPVVAGRGVRVQHVDERLRRPQRVDRDREQAAAVRDREARHGTGSRDRRAGEHLDGAALFDEQDAAVGQQIETDRPRLVRREDVDREAERQALGGGWGRQGEEGREGETAQGGAGMHGDMIVRAVARGQGCRRRTRPPRGRGHGSACCAGA